MHINKVVGVSYHGHGEDKEPGIDVEVISPPLDDGY